MNKDIDLNLIKSPHRFSLVIRPRVTGALADAHTLCEE